MSLPEKKFTPIKYCGKEKYVNLLEVHFILNKCVIKCDLIFILVKGVDQHNVSKNNYTKNPNFHAFMRILFF